MIISNNQGHLFLKSIVKDLKESMGPSFVKSKWQESGLQLKEWMNEDQVFLKIMNSCLMMSIFIYIMSQSFIIGENYFKTIFYRWRSG